MYYPFATKRWAPFTFHFTPPTNHSNPSFIPTLLLHQRKNVVFKLQVPLSHVHVWRGVNGCRRIGRYIHQIEVDWLEANSVAHTARTQDSRIRKGALCCRWVFRSIFELSSPLLSPSLSYTHPPLSLSLSPSSPFSLSFDSTRYFINNQSSTLFFSVVLEFVIVLIVLVIITFAVY